MKKTFAGPYENMEFPDYKFSEYPKLVTVEGADGKPERLVVNSQKEELAAIDKIVPTEDFKSVKDELSNAQVLLDEKEKAIKELEEKLAKLTKAQEQKSDEKPKINLPGAKS